MTKRRRCLAALLAAALVGVLVFSVFSVAAVCCHECAGENCPVCLLVGFCRDFLKLAALFCAVPAADITVRGAAHAVRSCRSARSCSYLNPVIFKIKLSD